MAKIFELGGGFFLGGCLGVRACVRAAGEQRHTTLLALTNWKLLTTERIDGAAAAAAGACLRGPTSLARTPPPSTQTARRPSRRCCRRAPSATQLAPLDTRRTMQICLFSFFFALEVFKLKNSVQILRMQIRE